MSSFRTKTWLMAAAVCLGGMCRPAVCQHYQPFGQFERNYDLQLFAPALVQNPDKAPLVREGIYFTYDRVYMKQSRPEMSSGEFPVQPPVQEDLPILFGDTYQNADWTWGNRFDLGYMMDRHTGWGLSIWSIRSPKERFIADTINRNDVIVVDVLEDPIGPLENTVNDGDLWSVELNRIFRFKRSGPHGGVFEPFFGIRYAQFDDNFLRTSFEVLEDQLFLDADGNGDLFETDEWRQLRAKRRNDMLGGQIGLRAYMRRGRWLLSTEFRAFALHNFQNLHARRRIEEGLQVTPIEEFELQEGDAEDFLSVTDSELKYNLNQFVVGGELRLEVAYELTRAMAIRAGLDVMDFAKGIGRGVERRNNEDLIMAGLTFGLTVNR